MFEMARTSALFGDTKERSEEILKALKFKVSYKSAVTDVSAVDNFITTITGECTLVPSLVKDTVAFYGDGEFQYSFDWSNKLGDTFNCSADPAAYHINLTEFDTEKEIISLDYDKLWSEYDHADIISAITGTSGATIDYEVISAYQSIGELLNGYTNGKFPFKLPLQNKNKTAGETTLSYEGNALGKVNITITVTLTHTPE
jgi:hypothetical protein